MCDKNKCMDVYSYKVESLGHGYEPEELARVLNRHGQQGWLFCHMLTNGALHGGGAFVIFARRGNPSDPTRNSSF